MPTNPSINLVEIDRKPSLSCQFEDVDISSYDTIVLRLRQPGGKLVEIEATIDDAADGLFHFDWPDGALLPGVSTFEIVFTDADGLEMTLPADAPIRGIVRERV